MEPSTSRGPDIPREPAKKRKIDNFQPHLDKVNSSDSTNGVEVNRQLEEFKQGMKTALKSIQRLFECVVCLAVLSSPSVTCVNGHNICFTCKGTEANCPYCRDKFSNVKDNLIVRQVIGSLPQICMYQNCPKLFKLGDNHEMHCPHRLTQCRMKGCNWVGPVVRLRRHLKESGKMGTVLSMDVEYDSFILPYSTEKPCTWVEVNTLIGGHFLWLVASNDLSKGLLAVSYFPVFNGKTPAYDFNVTLSFRSEYILKSEYRVSIKIASDLKEDERKDNVIFIPISTLRYYVDKKRGLPNILCVSYSEN